MAVDQGAFSTRPITPIDWSGPFVKGSIGYRWAEDIGAIGLGVGADIQRGSTVIGFGGGIETELGYQGSLRNQFTAVATGRIGYAFDQFLPFVFAGPAVTTFEHSGVGATSAVGWTAGAGLGYHLNRNWSLTAELGYFDFGTVNNSAGLQQRLNYGQARVGFSYAFPMAWPSP